MKKVLILIIFCFTVFVSNSQIIQNQKRIDDIDKLFEIQKLLFLHKSPLIFDILNEAKTTDEKYALKFLYAYMPLSDLADYDGKFFLNHIRITLKAKKEIPWVKNIPEDEFLHFVLPIRVNNENLDSFRTAYYQELKNRVQGLSMYDAALEINHWCHEKVTYKGSDSRTSSPMNTLKYSFGRCGEESVFTVAALRTVGIPARQVYTPRWAHSDDNHAWVEVWIDGKWYFMGACEPEPELNMGWFAFPASRSMLVHTRTYGRYFGKEEVISQQSEFSELNLIKNYAETKKITVLVTDENNNPIEDANVDFTIYNYAEFFPIARTKTDQNGLTEISLGLGELIVWANFENYYDIKKVTVSETDTIKLKITQKPIETRTFDLNFTPPTGKFIAEYSGSKTEKNRQRIISEDSIRSLYMSTFKDSLQAQQIAIELGYEPNDVIGFIVRSYGNHDEIIKFLNQCPKNLHAEAVLLLNAISEKDLRDVTSSILLDHLLEAPSTKNTGLSLDIYANYILNGRILTENLVAWRSFLKKEMPMQLQASEITTEILIDWVKKRIRIDNKANILSRNPITPIGVFKLRSADSRSRNIFFVALCRTFGIAARINPETEVPQYYAANEWVNVWLDKKTEKNTFQNAIITFSNPTKNNHIKYYNSFTLSRLNEGSYQTLEYPEGKSLSEFEGEKLTVFAGDYLLVTGNRLSDGTVMTRLSFFNLPPSTQMTIPVSIREINVKKENYGFVFLENIELQEFNSNKTFNLIKNRNKNGMLIVFIDPDKEPSKHVMHDLALVKTDLEKWNGNILFILFPEILSSTFNTTYFKGLPSQSLFLLDKNKKLFNLFAKNKPKNLPFVSLITSEGKIKFMSDGYRIGIGDEILKIILQK